MIHTYRTHLLYLLLATVWAHSTVQSAPVDPGANLWNIIAAATVTQESIISSLSTFSCGSQVGADIIITSTMIPYTITQSGTYLLIEDVAIPTKNTNGITVNVSNVTLNLGGHRINGGLQDNTQGVLINTVNSVVVRNGLITGTTTAGVACNAVTGPCLLEYLACTDFEQTGFNIGGASSSVVIDHCIVANGTSTLVGSDVRGLWFTGNSTGCWIKNCFVYNLVGSTSTNGNNNAYGYLVDSGSIDNVFQDNVSSTLSSPVLILIGGSINITGFRSSAQYTVFTRCIAYSSNAALIDLLNTTGRGFDLTGSDSVITQSIAFSNRSIGFNLAADFIVLRDSLATFNGNLLNALLTNAGGIVIANSDVVIGCETSFNFIGIAASLLISPAPLIQNNLATNNLLNYFNVGSIVSPLVVTGNTGYWANIG